jgi:Zn-dependent protease with chaperone function
MATRARTNGQWLISVVTLVVANAWLTAQTRVVAPKNKYTPAQDVELGLQAAAEARKQLPLLKDDAVTSVVEHLGRRLVDATPTDMRHPEFKYTFEVVNVREINAFALPGGPMFVNRGMMESASTEGEVAGVMAHEISHVVLRHGTAQASKATKFQIGQVLGAIGGAIVGGAVGSVIAQGTQFGLGAAFLRYGRDYEKQADLLGAQIMARAHYDPREMANMFKTIEKQGGPSGPEWLSDHPNPANRYEYIVGEAGKLTVTDPIRASESFARLKDHLKTLPPAPSTEEATRAAKRRTTTSTTNERPTGRVEAPSARYQTYNEGNTFQISVPANWREIAGSNAVTFAPSGAYGDYNGQSVFTHGVQVGVARSGGRDLRTSTDTLINSLREGNTRMSHSAGYRSVSLDGRTALQTSLGNVSEVTGRDEAIQLVTTETRRGDLLYAIAVVPRDELYAYESTFQRVLGSIRIRD